MDNINIFEQAVKVMPAEDIKNNGSDLYLKVTPESAHIIGVFPYKNLVTRFVGGDGKQWYEVINGYPISFLNESRADDDEQTTSLRNAYLDALLSSFKANYKRFYDEDLESLMSIDVYNVVIDMGDTYLRDTANAGFVKAFVTLRGDVLSSDREIAAFTLTLFDYRELDKPADMFETYQLVG